jgi:hypothetical protein
MQWAYLFVMAPCVTAVAYPWTVEHGTVAAGIATGMGDWVMVCVAVFASAPQNPATLCRDEEEGFALAFGMIAPASWQC